MLLRQLQATDISQINNLWERCHKGIHGIPKRQFLLTDAVTVSKDKVVGYGIVRMFAEALLYLDKDISKFQQAKSFKMLMEYAIATCKESGLDQLNVGIIDPTFGDIMRENYNFKDRESILFKEF